MDDYWLERRHQALKNSRSAESAELRALFLAVAEHCRSLELWCSEPAANAAAPPRLSAQTFARAVVGAGFGNY